MNKVYERIEQLERELSSPHVRSDASRIRALLTDDFEEVGTSGKPHSRKDVLDTIGGSGDAAYDLSDFSFVRLSASSVLTKYTASKDGQPTRRASVWVFRDGSWRMCYHQSSLITDE